MQIDKSQILDMLRSQGDHTKAEQAQAELPDRIDTDQDKGLLDRLGINADSMLDKLPGGLGQKVEGQIEGRLGGINL